MDSYDKKKLIQQRLESFQSQDNSKYSIPPPREPAPQKVIPKKRKKDNDFCCII